MFIGFASQFEAGQVGVTNGAEEDAGFAGVAQLAVRQFPKIVRRVRFPSPAFYPPSGTGRPRGEARWQWQVDATLFHAACQFRWCRQNAYGHWGRRLPGGGSKNVLLHNWVLEQAYGVAPHGELTTDHIDGDPSNNCLSNLRPATRLLQDLNKKGSWGVSVEKGRFFARLCHRRLGTFSTEQEARAAYLTAKSQAIAEEVRKSWELFSRQVKEASDG